MTVCASCGHETAEDANFCPKCGAPYEPPHSSRELRKTVTVVFCDVTGSTALGESMDPEALRGLLGRYFERMEGIVEAHGGSVEKFIGDAVLAVFGVPVTHEDDAMRACRAAAEMRDALPEVGIQGRIGVNTGEVVTGSGEQRLATGDAINVAARLEQAAEPGEVLIGEATLRLVRSVVEVGEERRLELKGKSALVPAYPLISVLETPERAHTGRFVGRKRELVALHDAWERAVAGSRCELVTIVGDPGVGKSRLVAEFLAGLDARSVSGRCLSYGEGVTYWPVVEVVKQLGTLPRDERAAATMQSLLGENDALVDTDEIAWAFRKLLEDQAPLVVCFDDIQWGGETFLNLVESIALLSSGSPLLLVCMARPELLDRRAGWPETMRLEPLPQEEAEALVGAAVPNEVRERIVSASGGNPLFISEMLALAGDESHVEVPATLRAVLAARLDQLDAAERNVLERGAVEGPLFHRGSVQALAPEETELIPRLVALVRRDLVHPDRAQFAHEDAYRFRHLLIRDAAYEALPKATRADLHRRFAAWLEQRAGERLPKYEEILGYHLEQAHNLRAQVGLVDTDTRELGVRAGSLLASCGRRALGRGDVSAALNLLERALALLESGGAGTTEVLLDWGTALIEAGEATRAEGVLTRAINTAATSGERRFVLYAQMQRSGLRVDLRPELGWENLRSEAKEAMEFFETGGDHLGLARAWRRIGFIDAVAFQWQSAGDAFEQARHHAKLVGDAHEEALATGFLFHCLVSGPLPISEALSRCEILLAELSKYRTVEAVGLAALANLHAMVGGFDEARRLVTASDEILADLGQTRRMVETAFLAAAVELLAGKPDHAVAKLRPAYDLFTATGHMGYAASLAAALAEGLEALGEDVEAGAMTITCEQTAGDDDLDSQVRWRQVRARLLARQGDLGAAEQVAREAVERVAASDALNMRAGTLVDLAGVLYRAGKSADARAAALEARELYARKGNLVEGARAEQLTAEATGPLVSPAPP